MTDSRLKKVLKICKLILPDSQDPRTYCSNTVLHLNIVCYFSIENMCQQKMFKFEKKENVKEINKSMNNN